MHRQAKGIDPELFAPSAGSGAPSGSYGGPAQGFASSGLYGKPSYDDYYGSSNQYAQQQQQQQSLVSIELEHVSGYTGKGKSTIHAHPTDSDSYITWSLYGFCTTQRCVDTDVNAAETAWAPPWSLAMSARATRRSCYEATMKKSMYWVCPTREDSWPRPRSAHGGSRYQSSSSSVFPTGLLTLLICSFQGPRRCCGRVGPEFSTGAVPAHCVPEASAAAVLLP